MERLSIDKIRFFRVERTYAVKTGKWYFEFEAVTGGDMRVGWARPGCKPDVELGTDELAFVFDGYRVSSHFAFPCEEKFLFIAAKNIQLHMSCKGTVHTNHSNSLCVIWQGFQL